MTHQNYAKRTGNSAVWRLLNLVRQASVVTGELRTTLRCIVIGESEVAVRVRVGGIWDLDIYKGKVLSVEGV